jgi:tripartite-type tricarboxylate transporter receptor subunit TctC
VIIGLVFAVHPSVPASNLKELIAYAKANPGKLSYGSAGVGTSNHLAGEMFKLQAGTPDIQHVPYRGAGPATNDLLGGQIPMMVATMNGHLIELHKAGKIRILAVATPARFAGAPDIPTAIESGMPDMNAQNWYSLFAPKGTPGAIIEQIAQATRKAMADPGLQQILVSGGMEPDLDSSPEKASRLVAEEIARWTPIIKAIGLKLD